MNFPSLVLLLAFVTSVLTTSIKWDHRQWWLMVKEKIMVVDDEEDILDLVWFKLSRDGYDVVCAGSGERALEIVKAQSIVLIVFDRMLPGLDGLTMAKQLKRDPICYHIPIRDTCASGVQTR